MNNRILKEVVNKHDSSATDANKLLAETSNDTTPVLDMKDQPSGQQQPQQQQQTGFNFSEYDAKDMKQIKAKEYLEELAQQVREKKQQKQREKDESDRLDRQHEVDNANFNPYGRSGCGAPLKNRGGDTMANLRQADPFQYSSSTTDNGNNFYSGHNATSASSHQTSGGANASVSHQGEPFFPRGSSKGAFGSSDDKTDEKKKQDEKYKEELRQQIEGNQRKKQFDKEQLRLEDERDMRIGQEHRQHEADLEEAERRRRFNNNNQGGQAQQQQQRPPAEKSHNGDMPNRAAPRKLEARPF